MTKYLLSSPARNASQHEAGRRATRGGEGSLQDIIVLICRGWACPCPTTVSHKGWPYRF